MNPLQHGCWNRIGVWGHETPRCPLLTEVIHCRNCHVFSAAGRDVLNGNAPPGYIEEWTRTLAKSQAVVRTGTESVMVFRVGDETLALPTIFMHQVLAMRPVHIIPHRSNAVVQGLTNVQGRLQLCLSLEGLLGLTSDADSPQRFLILFGRQDERYALPVRDVLGLTRYDPQALNETRIGSHVRFVRGILQYQDRPVGLLDTDKVCEALAQALYR